MVKAVIGDETRFKSIEDRLFNSSNLPCEVGLVIGKLNSSLDRAFIFDLIPTPPNDNSQPASSLSSTKTDSITNKKKPTKPNPNSSPSLLLDTDWISEHARQVSQMLLGGINVIGVYLWSPETSFNSSTTAIWQVIKALPMKLSYDEFDLNDKERIVVHFSYSPRKLSVRSCTISSSSFRVCEFKFGKVLSSLRSFKCLYNFEVHMPIYRGFRGTLRDILRDGILRHGKELRDVKAIIDGNLVRDDDNDGDDRLSVKDSLHNVELLLPMGRDFVGEVKEEVIGIVVFSGFLCSYAYLSPKESILQAIRDIKGDIVMSLQSRLNIICDEAEEVMGDGEKEESVGISSDRLHFLQKPTSLSFPRRVLVPWLGDMFICDYLQPSETFDVVKDHCKELMSMEAPTDTSVMLEPEKEAISLTMKSFWDVVAFSNSAFGSESNSVVKSDRDFVQMEGSKISANSSSLTVITAIAILLLAIVIGFLFYRA
ncbi:odr-4-like protein [Thalictrum thalictroides]|uniref:Odr-4-like protein n=1 Tax=Thalictrum thalictroides TaxID=46969 RepID=A0A7J6X973_THATH|nr:odr-4-like protein [Thalictrum thalictroides]